jgi:hypothetical protein
MSKFFNHAQAAMVGALLAGLTGCGGGDSNDPPQSNNPPAPAPAPAPPPPPPPPAVPPLSSVIVDLDDNHAVGTQHWPNGNTATGGQGEPVQGIPCVLPPIPQAYHVHAHVSIFLDGVQLQFPPNVGIHSQQPQRCFYLMHTHDRSGTIHVEDAAPGTFTLGNLFAIWGQPLETDNVAGLTGKPITIYSTDNATVTEVTTDWKAIELTTHKLITIQVGTPIAEIPNYTWSGN